MFKNSQIPAFFLLGIFLILLIHNAVPHVHHSHESTGKIALVTDHDHHSHDHDHHSHTQNKNDNDRNGLIALLINSHSHHFHIHGFSQFTKRDAQVSKDQLIPVIAGVEVIRIISDIESREHTLYSPARTLWSDNPFLFSCPGRAPPYIG